MARYSHQYLIAFTIENDKADPREVTIRELMTGLQGRACDIALDDNGIEAFQHNDTAEV